MSKKRGQFSADDLKIWRQVAETAKPLRAEKRSIQTEVKAPKPVSSKARLLSGSTAKPRPTPEPSVRLDLAKDPMQHLKDQPAQMDAKKHRRMKRGKLKPDAKIDLHGLTLDRAHKALTDFLLTAHGRGDRLVLVVTGKGRDPEIHHGAVPGRKGVLRQSVPRWLSLPPLSGIVLQITPASQRHGGEGAYYVYLKRVRAK